MRLAGFQPAGVLCEVTNPDGTMARLPEIMAFAARHSMVCLTIEDIVEYRRKMEGVAAPELCAVQ
jgi:3,4-dihydroxy 2-butanone 4-phosphate synthase